MQSKEKKAKKQELTKESEAKKAETYKSGLVRAQIGASSLVSQRYFDASQPKPFASSSIWCICIYIAAPIHPPISPQSTRAAIFFFFFFLLLLLLLLFDHRISFKTSFVMKSSL